MNSFSLAHLTVLGLPPPEMVRVAARTGYHYVGLRMIAVTDTTPGYPLMQEPAMMRDTKAALAETGVRVLDIEFVKITRRSTWPVWSGSWRPARNSAPST